MSKFTEAYLVFEGGRSKKFWHIWQGHTGERMNEVTINYGRLGTEGNIRGLEFVSADAALMDLQERVVLKLAKGYKLADSSINNNEQLKHLAASFEPKAAPPKPSRARKK
jgi:predicted DNA-binding WGR domain protein